MGLGWDATAIAAVISLDLSGTIEKPMYSPKLACYWAHRLET
jgi:hypothetical protein